MEFTELLSYQGTMMPLVLILIGSWATYHLLTIMYNVSPFHPLSHIPGPTLARATYLPEFYYDFIKHGRYTNSIEKMHEEYGNAGNTM